MPSRRSDGLPLFKEWRAVANSPQRFQFHLSSLLIGITAACAVFALVGRFGVDGLLERAFLAFSITGIFTPLIDLYWWWKKNDMDDI